MHFVQSYTGGLTGIRADNPEIELRLGHDAELPDEPVLMVAYPEPSDDPSGRDVWCDAEITDWTVGSGVEVRVKAAHAEKLSVSFLDRNRVAYTAWFDLPAGAWHPVHLLFAQLRPNPYVQPDDARTGAPIDVGDVAGIGFSPQGRRSGRLTLSRFVLTR